MVTIKDSIVVNNPNAAFDALTSRDGARHFRSIGSYETYVTDGQKTQVSYASPFGPVQTTMVREINCIKFSGRGPFGVSFRGAWTLSGNTIALEFAPSVPSFLVKSSINRTLQDLSAI